MAEELGPPFTTITVPLQTSQRFRELVERHFVAAMQRVFASNHPVVFAVLPPTERQRVEGVRVVDITMVEERPVEQLKFTVSLATEKKR